MREEDDSLLARIEVRLCAKGHYADADMRSNASRANSTEQALRSLQ